MRNLGVTVDNCLKFHNHTNLTITKANQYFMQYKEPDMIIKLYKSLVRPIVEYGNPVWGPYYITDQRSIEGVQRCATKLVPSIRHHTYPERLQILNLPSLYYRRYRGDMILMYQVTHKNIDGLPFNLFTVAPVSATKVHNFKHSCTSCYRANLFSFRSINKWNNLPSYSTLLMLTLLANSFKNVLDNFCSDILFTVI